MEWCKGGYPSRSRIASAVTPSRINSSRPSAASPQSKCSVDFWGGWQGGECDLFSAGTVLKAAKARPVSRLVLPSDPEAVWLVSMPYGVLQRPSLALGSLQASLRRAGLACRTVYANLEFARRVGLGPYNLIGSSDAKDLLGEWTFARAAFGSRSEDLRAYHNEIYFDYFEHLGLTPEALWQALQHLREQAEPFIHELARALIGAGARLVGCSSTFQQHCASLALLRHLKELDPGITTVMGGANCEAEMGLALKRNCGWLDYVASGEADLLIVDLVQAIRQPRSGPIPYGVVEASHPSMAGSSSNTGVPRARVAHLDALPTPDYYDYFDTLARTGLGRYLRPGLAVETSRGCWWGEKHHCTFCGLNGAGMGFRLKSAERARFEFDQLAQRHGLEDFLVMDNILGMESFKTLLPRLADSPRDYRLFVETKANLKKAQVQALAQAGACWILPGLEGLHDAQLRLMDKGTTGVVNIQTLKWCRELGMRVSWSILWGFPGEEDAWYAEMADWIPSLEHLQPPASLCRIGYHRFSPYHARPQDFGIRHVPSPAYARVYPFPEDQLEDLAYFFVDAPGSGDQQEGPGLRRLRQELAAWVLRFESQGLPAILSMLDRDGQLEIIDSRSQAPKMRHLLTKTRRQIYLACDSAQSRQSLLAQVAVPESELEEVLQSLLADRLLFQHGGRYLALATRGDLPALPHQADFPGGSLVPRPESLIDPPWMAALLQGSAD